MTNAFPTVIIQTEREREDKLIMNTNEMIKYNMMVEYNIATAEELNLVRQVLSGSWNEVLDAVCYARTGYNTWEQYLAKIMEEE